MRHAPRFPITFHRPVILLTGWLFTCAACGMDKPYPGPHIESDEILVVLRPHAPDQITAFYEARGFPKEAIQLIAQTCFITVHIENRSGKVIWLDTGLWSFTGNGKPLKRLDRSWWEAQWERIELRQASRSTFGWTQLPELRDLQPDEPVGGNIVFPGSTRMFSMTLNMPTGPARRDGLITLVFRDIECPKEVTAP